MLGEIYWHIILKLSISYFEMKNNTKQKLTEDGKSERVILECGRIDLERRADKRHDLIVAVDRALFLLAAAA